MENNENKKSIQDKIATLKYNPSDETHLKLNIDKCKKCSQKICTVICPAGVYSDDNQGGIIVQYENCLECGACRIACPYGTISWEYPKSACGVIFKNS